MRCGACRGCRAGELCDFVAFRIEVVGPEPPCEAPLPLPPAVVCDCAAGVGACDMSLAERLLFERPTDCDYMGWLLSLAPAQRGPAVGELHAVAAVVVFLRACADRR